MAVPNDLQVKSAGGVCFKIRLHRPAGYIVASGESKAFDDPGIFVEIPLVNQIRPRVAAWREAGYPGVSSITKRLLEHWQDPQEYEGDPAVFPLQADQRNGLGSSYFTNRPNNLAKNPELVGKLQRSSRGLKSPL